MIERRLCATSRRLRPDPITRTEVGQGEVDAIDIAEPALVAGGADGAIRIAALATTATARTVGRRFISPTERLAKLMKISVETRFQKYVHMTNQFIIDFGEPGVSVDLFTSDLRFVNTNGERLLGVGESDDDRFLNEFLSQVVVGSSATVSISDSSELVMEFPGLETSVAALPGEDFEGWSVRFKPPVADGISFIVCLPKGRLAEFGPTQ